MAKSTHLGGGLVVDFDEGNVKDGAVGLALVAVRSVGCDTDDLVDGFVGATFKGAADGLLAGEEGLREGSVHDGGSRRGTSGRKSRPETRGISSSPRAEPG